MKTMISLAAAALLATVSIASAQNTKPSDSTPAGADSTQRTTSPSGMAPQGATKATPDKPSEASTVGADSQKRTAAPTGMGAPSQPATTGAGMPANKPSERNPAGADSIGRETQQTKPNAASK